MLWWDGLLNICIIIVLKKIRLVITLMITLIIIITIMILIISIISYFLPAWRVILSVPSDFQKFQTLKNISIYKHFQRVRFCINTYSHRTVSQITPACLAMGFLMEILILEFSVIKTIGIWGCFQGAISYARYPLTKMVLWNLPAGASWWSYFLAVFVGKVVFDIFVLKTIGIWGCVESSCAYTNYPLTPSRWKEVCTSELLGFAGKMNSQKINGQINSI